MNFLKFRTDVFYYFNNFKIIIDKTILLCYNDFVHKGKKIKPLTKIKTNQYIKEKNMKVKKENYKIIIESEQMEIVNSFSNYTEDVYFDYIKLIGAANKISSEKEIEELAEKFNEDYDGNGILYQLPKFFETASEIEIRFEDAVNEISPYFIGTLKTVKEIYPEANKIEIYNDYVKIIYDKEDIEIIVSDSEFNEEIWINAKEGTAKYRFEGESCKTVEEFEKYAVETVDEWIKSLKEYRYIDYSEIRKIIMIDDTEDTVKILK